MVNFLGFEVLLFLLYIIASVNGTLEKSYMCDDSVDVESKGDLTGHPWAICLVSFNTPVLSEGLQKISVYKQMDENYYFRCKKLDNRWYNAKGNKLEDREVNITCPVPKSKHTYSEKLSMCIAMSKGTSEDVGLFDIRVSTGEKGETVELCSFNFSLSEITDVQGHSPMSDRNGNCLIHRLAIIIGVTQPFIALLITYLLCKCIQSKDNTRDIISSSTENSKMTSQTSSNSAEDKTSTYAEIKQDLDESNIKLLSENSNKEAGDENRKKYVQARRTRLDVGKARD